jgi:hypothetical protein
MIRTPTGLHGYTLEQLEALWSNYAGIEAGNTSQARTGRPMSASRSS